MPRKSPLINASLSPAVSGVLFDLDGTLVDTAPDLVAALNLALREHKFSQVELEDVRFAASHGSMALVRAAQPDVEETKAIALQQALLFHYARVNGDHCQLFDGVSELLSQLIRTGIPYGIVTNKAARFSRPLIKKLGLAQSCQSLISGDSVTRGKPDAAPMLLAANQLSRHPEHIFYLGDAKRDMEAARAAQMISVLANWGYIGAEDDTGSWPVDLALEHPQELIRQWTGDF